MCVSAPLIVRPLPLMVIALAICGSSPLSVILAVILIVSASLLPLAELMAVVRVSVLLALNVAARAGATDSSRKTSAASINLNGEAEGKSSNGVLLLDITGGGGERYHNCRLARAFRTATAELERIRQRHEQRTSLRLWDG